MKVRLGFVSNSSSSSFVCWGVSKDNIEFTDKTYLALFDDELKNFEKMKVERPESFEKWYKEDYAKMVSLDTDEEKIEYAQDNLEDDNLYEMGDFEIGGPERDFVGITPEHLVKNYPDMKFGAVYQFVADKLNETYGTSFKIKDITYYEEGWRDG
jgi:hypothetical protein